ncbi:MAG: tetratricopeptide repeat protein, partial [Anaerolineae bacterium]|nr:tetratricopeptide repeat protein [Anaerolineae bacterium]
FVDRAHNFLLDWTLIAGIPGLLAFLLILLLFTCSVGRAAGQSHRTEKRALLIAILAAVLGNTAHNLVSFDVTPTATATWLLMGLGVALVAPSPASINNLVKKPVIWQWTVVGLLTVALGTAIWQLNGRPIIADIAARAAHRAMQADDGAKSIAAGQQAVAYWPHEPAHHLRLSQLYLQQAIVDPDAAQSWLSKAETTLRSARQLRPDDPAVWLHTAHFYTVTARQFGGYSHDQVNDAYRQALLLAPNHATIYLAWGKSLLENNDLPHAAALLRQAVILDASQGEAYIYLGATELALGRFEIALADYKEAVRILPQSGQAYAGLARCYWLLDRPQEAWLALEKARQYDPLNAQARVLRQEIGNSP